MFALEGLLIRVNSSTFLLINFLAQKGDWSLTEITVDLVGNSFFFSNQRFEQFQKFGSSQGAPIFGAVVTSQPLTRAILRSFRNYYIFSPLIQGLESSSVASVEYPKTSGQLGEISDFHFQKSLHI